MRGPLAASRRYYPGFFGALFLVVLRMAIGWHFLYEGTQKILSTPEGKASILAKVFPIPDGPPFSSEGYLRASIGPLAPKFRSIIPDADSRDKLDLAKLEQSWADEVDRVATVYEFDAEQAGKANAILKDRKAVAETWFQSVENREKIKKYFADLADVETIERNPNALAYERELARKDRKEAETERRDLVKEIDPWTAVLRDGLTAIVTPNQARAHGDYHPPLTTLNQADRLTMYGLTAVGLCLILGLFTPLAALGGGAYLLSFYLSVPPWPWLPEPDKVEGHYLYVNKNLIEMLSCLVLASTPSGLWIGLDAVLFGWIGRGRRRREAAEARSQAEAQAESNRPVSQDRRKFKSR